MLRSIHHPAPQKTESTPTLVMLHGRGADEHDLFGLREHLDPRLEIYSVRAPFEYEWGGYSWFDLFEDGTVDEKSFARSTQEILSFIDGIKSGRLFLLGFSMGAIMSYAVALTHPTLCAGIAALSGFAPGQLEKEYRLQDLSGLPIFISHGINDPVIPVASARGTRDLLARSTAFVEYHEYATAHQIDEACLADLSAWLTRTL